jgi:hypothetical protein
LYDVFSEITSGTGRTRAAQSDGSEAPGASVPKRSPGAGVGVGLGVGLGLGVAVGLGLGVAVGMGVGVGVAQAVVTVREIHCDRQSPRRVRTPSEYVLQPRSIVKRYDVEPVVSR